jgi:hypothetical protein
MNFFKRYLFKKALLEDELANVERSKKEEVVIEKQPEPIVIESSPQKPAAVAQITTQPPRKNEIKGKFNYIHL